MKYEVRCCCDARLLGHIDLSPELTKSQCVIFPKMAGGALRLDVALLTRGGVSYKALKAHHIPMDTLMRIRGFEPFRGGT